MTYLVLRCSRGAPPGPRPAPVVPCRGEACLWPRWGAKARGGTRARLKPALSPSQTPRRAKLALLIIRIYYRYQIQYKMKYGCIE